MFSPEEINNGVSPLTRTKARALGFIIRNSAAYEADRARYSGVDDALLALVSAPQSASGAESTQDAAIKAKTMDALLTALPDEVGRGTVARQGGDEGKDYSQVRDREDLIRFALCVLFDEEQLSSEPASSYVVITPHTSYGCGSCGNTGCWRCGGYARY